MRAYAGDWALFTDWCHTVGEWELPADPDTVLFFLTDCPAAPATHRRRVAAIDHHHAAAGYRRPGDSNVVRAALGRPVPDTTAAPAMSEEVAAALRGLPSHGWTRGMFGRRDGCLLVLSELAGVPYRHLATLTAADVTMAAGTAQVENAAGAWMVAHHQDPALCGSCAVVRWLRVLNLVITRPGKRDLAQALKKAKPVTSSSPHLCRSTRPIDTATATVPLLPPIDQWGYIPFPVQRLTPHSLSRRARDLLAGDLGVHRDLPVDTDDETEAAAPVAVSAPPAVYTREDAQWARDRRRADLAKVASVSDVLADIDRRAGELGRRFDALLAVADLPGAEE